MTITIKDVAKRAGVSASTVSRTCSDSASISEETKEKVRRAMDELGYKPNFQASSLANKTAKSIGIILPESQSETFENSFYLEVLRGIGKYCNEKNYMNTLITGENVDELIHTISSAWKSNKACAFILLYSNTSDPVLEYLNTTKIPYTLIGKPYTNANHTVYIDNDNILAAREATQYLISLGHERIAFIGGNFHRIFNQDRKAGYQLALEDHHILPDDHYILEITGKIDTQDVAIASLFQNKPWPSAILVSDDLLAMSLEKVCTSLGISIPDQISIISFNNSLFARLIPPQLTSVDINAYQLGIESAVQTIAHIENPSLPATKSIVPHQLIKRNSTTNVKKFNIE